MSNVRSDKEFDHGELFFDTTKTVVGEGCAVLKAALCWGSGLRNSTAEKYFFSRSPRKVPPDAVPFFSVADLRSLSVANLTGETTRKISSATSAISLERLSSNE